MLFQPLFKHRKYTNKSKNSNNKHEHNNSINNNNNNSNNILYYALVIISHSQSFTLAHVSYRIRHYMHPFLTLSHL